MSLKTLWIAVTAVFVMCCVGCDQKNTCNLRMFGGDVAAYYACQAEFALQSNWFPSPVSERFSYQAWNGFGGFWRNGVVLEPLVNFLKYANNTRFLSVIESSYRELPDLVRAYFPYPSFDDMGWYGLSFTRIYEVLGLEKFLETAVDIFYWCWEKGWDDDGQCGGGFWFDYRKKSKQTITNVVMFQLAAKLYNLKKNESTFLRLLKIYDFIAGNKILNSTTFLLSGGVNETDCAGDGSEAYTYNHGVLTGGLVEMYKITNKTLYLDLACNISQAAMRHYSRKSGILTESCDPNCNDDQKMFKGIFVRNVRYLIDTLPLQNNQTRNIYTKWLDNNMKAILKLDICNKCPISKCNIIFADGPPYYNVSGPVFSPDWNGPFTFGAPMQQFSALELFVSNICPGTRCYGELCTFDLPYPISHRLTRR